MITKAYIHEYGNGRLEPEHLDVKTTLDARGVECELFTSKKLIRNQLDLTKDTLVVGDHPTIKTALKLLKLDYTKTSYPVSLQLYLKREIWESTVKKLLMQSYQRELTLFVKPKDRAKLFTGFVINSNNGLYKLDMISKNTSVYCSSVVKWLSEYRVFVINSEIVGIKNYDGDSTILLDMNVVKGAILAFEKSNEKTAGYGIDFGVLNTGETALVEWNDGFALGSYKLDKEIYTGLITSRWEEIVQDL